ncbi:MAG TPA: CBS domain-containing protein [Anaerolineales bacterium]|nr:CBS domain-containing protein [Anaerolineales bacterium]
MLVREYMRANPSTVLPKTTCSNAFRLMQEKDIYKLPVVAEEGELVGMVTQKDLLYVLPSSAALLSVSEIDSLFGKMTVERVMTRRVISVSEDCPLEEAARILVDNKIGSLPVVRDGRLVGMITKADILRVMMEALGGRMEGLRVMVRLQEDTGELGAITDGIVQLGGTLINLSTFWGGDPFHQTVTLKVQGIDPLELMSLLENNIGVQVIDHRQSGAEYQAEIVSPPVNKAVFPFQKLSSELIRFTDSR